MKGSTIIPFVTDIDYNIGKWLNGMLHSTNGRFTPILKFITSLGNVGIAFIITALIMLLFLRTRKVGMLLLVSMLLGIILTNLILKNVIARPRPYLNQLSDFYMVEWSRCFTWNWLFISIWPYYCRNGFWIYIISML